MRNALRVVGVSIAVGSVMLLGTAANGQSSSTPQRGKTWEIRKPPQSSPPPLKVEPQSVELGDVMAESKRKTIITVTNTGTEPLKIDKYSSTCWCTVLEPEKMEIAPKESITLKAEVEAPDMMGELGRQIFVFFENFAQPVVIEVNGYVSRGVRAELEYEPLGQTRTGWIRLEATKEPFRVMGVNGQPPEFRSGELSGDSTVMECWVKYDVGQGPDEQLPEWFLIELEHSTAPVIDLHVENPWRELNRTPRRWVFSSERLLLGNMKPGEVREVTVTLRGVRGGTMNSLQGVGVSPHGFSAQVLGLESNDEGLVVRLGVSVDESHHGLLVGEVAFTHDDETHVLPMMGRVGK